MGSFLVSCCATNQSISGEEVYVIPIFENIKTVENKQGLPLQGLDRLTYNTDLYGLLGFIFSGSYHDYGQYDIDWDKPSNKYMLENYLAFLKKSAVFIEQGENPYHDPPFNPIDLEVDGTNYQAIWEYIHEVIWEGRLFLRKQNYRGGYLYTKVEYFVAHKPNMDILLDMYQNRDRSRGYYFNDDEKEFYLKSTEEKAKILFDELLQEKLDSHDPDKRLQALMREHSDRKIHFYGEFYTSDSNVAWRPIKRVKEALVNDYENKYEDYLDIYKAFVSIKEIVTSLSYCNIIFRPVYYASQDYSNSFGLRFGHWMDLIHQRNINNDDFEAYYEEDEVEEDIEISLEKKKEIVAKDAESFVY